MLRKQTFKFLVILGVVASLAGCQTLGSVPFIPQSAGLPAQSE